jgi:hypothetical protein
MSCDCYTIGGRWIAEDPDCPVHGTEAQRKRNEAGNLRTLINNAETFAELKDLLIEVLYLIED